MGVTKKQVRRIIRKILSCRVSNTMDGVNRALDNIFVERFWRSLEHSTPDTIYESRFAVRELRKAA